MLDRKKQLIQELIAHLEDSQAGELGALVASKKPAPEAPMEVALDEVESASPMGKEEMPGVEATGDLDSMDAPEASGTAEMTDEELAELLRTLV